MLKAPILLGAVPPNRTRKDDSVERSLATVWEAHQKALSTLEEEIERLSRTRVHSQSRARSKSRDHQQQSREGQKKRCHKVQFEDQPAPSHSADPQTEPSEQGSNGEGSNLEDPPELKPMVASFLRGLPKTSEDKGKETSPEPPVVEFSWWVPWKAERCKTPKWWTELSAVPGKENSRKLGREVQASFRLPMAVVGIGFKRGHPPGSPCTTMSLQTKVYAAS